MGRVRAAMQISSQRISPRSLLATLGIAACVAASVAAGLGGPANAQPGDNPPPGLLAKIELATQATNRTTVKPSAAQAILEPRRFPNLSVIGRSSGIRLVLLHSAFDWLDGVSN